MESGKEIWRKYSWILTTILGSAIFAFGFAVFLEPNDVNTGGISGLAMVVVKLLGFGSVGVMSIVINCPLFILGGVKIGKKFFFGSLLGMLVSSLLIDGFALMPSFHVEPLMGAIYGGALCGAGIGMVFAAGTSTGGSDILVRLLKLSYRNVPIGRISMVFDMTVVILTGIVFQDITKALYSGIAVFITGQVMDLMVYRFDYSKVAMIVSEHHEEIALKISEKLDRGATFLKGEGAYTHQEKKVVLAVVKKQQLAELKELIMEIDPEAFVIVQEAHQVLGDGFSRYSKDSL